MCGRYASTKSRTDLVREFDISESYADEERPPDYNMAPTKRAPVVLTARHAARMRRSASCATFAGTRAVLGKASQGWEQDSLHQSRVYARCGPLNLGTHDLLSSRLLDSRS